MFLNAVILILQEILEAALLVAVLLAIARIFTSLWNEQETLSRSWLVYSLVLGILGGWFYAWATPTISEWFDYVGQEVSNAFLHIVGFIIIVGVCFFVPRHANSSQHRKTITQLALMTIVILALVREGSEIIIYLTGVTSQAENPSSVLLGASIGAGIGLSCGVFLYYSLSSLGTQASLRVCILLLVLICGNMVSQVVMLLTQADWLPYTPTAWDTSGLLSEQSVTGHLLYALVGYESNPSILQACCYLFGMLIPMFSPLFRQAWFASPEERVA